VIGDTFAANTLALAGFICTVAFCFIFFYLALTHITLL
jgi:hypothetical protein